MTAESVREKLVQYVQDTYLIEFGVDGIELTTDLFEAGVFDSMAMVNYTMFIEEEFGVQIEPEAVMESSLVSIDSSVRYIQGKLA